MRRTQILRVDLAVLQLLIKAILQTRLSANGRAPCQPRATPWEISRTENPQALKGRVNRQQTAGLGRLRDGRAKSEKLFPILRPENLVHDKNKPALEVMWAALSVLK